MGFLFGIPRKLIKRVTEIEIDTHYYDNDVVPSNQDIFTFDVDSKNKTAIITGFTSAAKNITTVVMPYRVKYGNDTSELWATVVGIKDGAFKNCTFLQNMTLPNTIHIIPKNCFSGCTSLHTVNIPKSIDEIKEYAFNDCENLQTVFIQCGVKIIESTAFLNCENLKILCYKYSEAEKYAKEYDIPYSLLSYTLDDDITENSHNLVTSGTIWNHITKLVKDITNHVLNKNNPHDVTKTQIGLSNVDNTSDKNKPLSDAAIAEFVKTNENVSNHLNNTTNPHNDSTFNNSSLTGITHIATGTLETMVKDNDKSLVNKEYVDSVINSINEPNEGSGYQTILDNDLDTNSKLVVGAINEINDKINYIQTDLKTGWNTVSLKKLYPLDWAFFSKPYCYTSDGLSVDYRIKNFKENVIDDSHAFDIYVPIDCRLNCATTASYEISGYAMDYILIKYYYTGYDGQDLDTITGVNNTNWPLSNYYVGYTTQHNREEITSSDGTTLIKWGGDNTGGGASNGDKKYYESIYLDIKHIQEQLPNEDIEIILYGTWYQTIGNGNIHVSLDCYTCDSIPKLSISDKVISLSSTDGTLLNTYSNEDMMSCKIVTKKGTPTDFKNVYTPAFKIILHKTVVNSNYRTITVQPLT